MQFQYANCVKSRRSRPSFEAMVRRLYGFATIQAKGLLPDLRTTRGG